jgi:hypothetical protein
LRIGLLVSRGFPGWGLRIAAFGGTLSWVRIFSDEEEGVKSLFPEVDWWESTGGREIGWSPEQRDAIVRFGEKGPAHLTQFGNYLA